MNESFHSHAYSHGEVRVDGEILAPNVIEGEAYLNELCYIYERVVFYKGLFAQGGGGCKDSQILLRVRNTSLENRSLGMNPSYRK